jgi:Gliding motility associated protein GldN
LQQNKDISWIGEGQVDFRLVIQDCVDSFENNSVEILKMIHPNRIQNVYKPYSFYTCEWITEQIINDLKDGKYSCYSNESLTNKLKTDTLRTFFAVRDTSPHEFEGCPYPCILSFDFNFEDIPLIRLKYLLYYNQKTKQFGNCNLAFAPLMMSKDDEGNKLGYKPMLWALFPDDNSSQETIYKNDNINYFIETSTRANNIPLITSFINLKGNLDLNKIVQNDIETPEKCVSADTFKPETLLNLKEMTNPMDTIESYSYVTNKSTISIVANHFKERLKKISLVHIWYYDNKKHQLYCRLTATAPVLDRLDEEGNLRYSFPLYYREAEQIRGKKKIKKTR